MNKFLKLKSFSLGVLMVIPMSTANAQGEPTAMQFVECDFDKTIEVYGFQQTPEKVVDGLNSALGIEVFEVSDYVVRFAYENPFQAISLYAKWNPDKVDGPPTTGLTVEVNRLTGEGKLVFTRPPSDVEKARCEQGRAWGCGDDLVMGTATGKCHAVARRF